MQVVILCGGQGTRLKEETEFRPKPMVNIGSHPILWHIMNIYSSFGHRDFILSLGYKGEMIKDYFLNYDYISNDAMVELGAPSRVKLFESHEKRDWRIVLANTGEKALKGARIKRVEKYVQGDRFMMTYADGLADVDIDGLLAFHQKHGKLATVTGINPSSRFGELAVSGDQVLKFNEKPKGESGYINGGFFVFERGVFDYLTADDGCDFEYGPLEKMARDGQLMIYKHHGQWACMDTPRDMDYLNKLWSENKAFWKKWE